jgi:hypothetical protein
MKPRPKTSPEFDRFSDFAKRVLSVPHAEIKAKLEAEKSVKAKRTQESETPASSDADGKKRIRR